MNKSNSGINLDEIIEKCSNNNIDCKLLKGFNVDVDMDYEFVFISKYKGIPSDRLKSYGITSSEYDINTSIDPYSRGYWLTRIELKSRKYNWNNLKVDIPTNNKNKVVDVQNKHSINEYAKLLEESRQYELRMSERRNWRGYLNYIDHYDGRML